MTDKLTPGQFLKDQLNKKGITQAELSKRTGYTQKHISHVVNGKNRITLQFALAVEEAVGIKAKRILRFQTDRELNNA